MFPGLRNATNYSGSQSTSSEIHPKSGYIATRAELVRATIGQGRRTRLRFIYIYIRPYRSGIVRTTQNAARNEKMGNEKRSLLLAAGSGKSGFHLQCYFYDRYTQPMRKRGEKEGRNSP